jgi:primosomal protein N' (replication factor Y)
MIAKAKGNYRHNIYVQTPKRAYLNKVLRFLVKEFESWPEAKKVKWSFDIDPIDIN